ncbi:MAG: bifunctional tetrahydrofolate synthase/dihydrofolate synthase [Pseudomonadota bacterium]|nr:bifunctional tetrahydrofolate synthase/dihydrofolate synthase [Pseudomonadota bacterium]
MRFDQLSEWLDWIQRLHPRAMDLGLDRVSAVYNRLGLGRIAHCVITVGGTNGKGSSAAMLEAILRQAGYRVGVYSSPHMVRYNERVRIDGRDVGDDALCEAFDRVDRVRRDESLTYFEFGTLAALDLFARERLDVAVLEVGMGGRLDAVNIVDPDVALITRIAIDHQAWLGATRDAIGREKAGITRACRPAVCGDPDPPAGFLQHATASPLYRQGQDFLVSSQDTQWQWRSDKRHLEHLPYPALPGRFQLHNAAAVLQVLACIEDRCPTAEDHIRAGLKAVRLPGRFEVVAGEVTQVFDVAHNPDAALTLADNLRALKSSGTRRAVLGMLRDKDVAGFGEALAGEVGLWYLASLGGDRALSAGELAERMAGVVPSEKIHLFSSVGQAFRTALADSCPGDVVLATGSFHTAGEARCESL